MKSTIDDKPGEKNTTALLVRRLRIEIGMTQQQLADRAGVSFSFVNQVEGGKPTVRLDVLNKILEVFGYAMAPSRMLAPMTAQSAWSALKMDSSPSMFAPIPPPPVASAPETRNEAASEPVRQNNDWAFYK